jgi:hypothetical protein
VDASRPHRPAVALRRSDVDTDQIIPSDWLKRVERTGFGRGLFSEWREDPGFVLNRRSTAASVLVAGENFGTGSSASTPSGPAGLRLPRRRQLPASPTSSAATPSRAGSCRCSSTVTSSSG